MGKSIPMCSLRQIFLTRQPRRGFSLVEMMVAVAILTFLLSAFFGLLNTGGSTFFNSDAGIDLRNSLRLASERIALELRNTGYKSNVAQFTILTGQGAGGSDILRFSVPVLCSSSSVLLDTDGNPNYWGAPLTWGCNSYTCMDADGSCSALEYKYVQYSINSSNQLERKVLDGNLLTVSGSTTIAGNNIADFRVSLSADARMITFVLTGQKKNTAAIVTATYSNDVLLNNLEG